MLHYKRNNERPSFKKGIRCGHCGKLLCRGEVVELEIRCPRCHADNIVRAASPNLERHDRPQGRDHEAFFSGCRDNPFPGGRPRHLAEPSGRLG
ncbi:Com family DNA-binding transcriptional regulator [Bilophila wadsworthia]|uniref:Com family DNA-binding transcriptional regulator n=1 Tax=Bilophila wadsworthia TaxID=35833 RepID=UPI00266DB151|nr:Com family DNA-binding transcriptional regulator [Bilophila wadsworthia]